MESKELEVASPRLLVGDGRREILLKKLEDFKVYNLTAKEKEKIDVFAHIFANRFTRMCYKLEGVSRKQLKDLEKDDWIEFDKMISGRVETRARLWKCFYACIPVLGWIWYFVSLSNSDCDSIDYVYSKN